MTPSFAGVTIGFSPSTYQIMESAGNVDLMIHVLSGQLNRSVTVNLETIGHGSIGEISGKDIALYTLQCQNNGDDTMQLIFVM